MWQALAARLEPFLRKLPDDPLARRSSAAIEAVLPLAEELQSLWFDPEVTGWENLPAGPVLVAGTHNGGNMAPDMFILMAAYWRRFGPRYPSYGLAHDVVMKLPGVGRMISLLGGVAANPQNAETLLRRGATVLVYPGGDLDAFRPLAERHVVKFGTRTGFVKIALRTRVPIVPCISVGAHETFAVLTDGRTFARRSGLRKLFRFDVFPIYLAAPWGLMVGPVESHLPLPSRIRVRLLEPIHFDHPPSAADDPELVKQLVESVRARMQAALDEMVEEGGFGVRERLRALWPI